MIVSFNVEYTGVSGVVTMEQIIFIRFDAHKFMHAYIHFLPVLLLRGLCYKMSCLVHRKVQISTELIKSNALSVTALSKR